MQSNQTKDNQEKIAKNVFGNLATASQKSEPRHPPNNLVCFNNSPSKIMKNAFYFILKALSFSKYLNFCLDILGM